MASNTLPKPVGETSGDPDENSPLALGPTVRALLRPLASLKLTVALFALAIFIVFAGTLAQTQNDVWVVMHDYFRPRPWSSSLGFAWIDVRVFFPKSFFQDLDLGSEPIVFPFPGGWLIGAAMAVNLLAAHAVRFTVQARGLRLWAGLGMLALGGLVTWLVIAGGSSDGLQGTPFFEWATLWTSVKLLLAALTATGVWGIARLEPERATERRVLIGLTAAVAALTTWLVIAGDKVALGDSSMRILWQLIQATLAGGLLLAGCWVVFRRRAGIVLLHAGIGLMMFSELLVGTAAVEGQMHIKEGDTVNFTQDIREVELALIDESDPESDTVVAIPQAVLQKGGLIHDERLPVDVKVVRYLQNSLPKFARDADAKDNLATTGVGLELAAVKKPAAVGVGSSGVDDTAAYVEFLQKGTDESLGTYLLTLMQSRLQESRDRAGLSAAEVRALTPPFLAKTDPLFAHMAGLSEPVVIDAQGKPVRVSLRFKRAYKPYSLTLDDVRTEYYPGTTTPKDYSSVVRLKDSSRNVDRDVRIWMNNPLRFAGETFYQSSVMPDPITGEEMTGLQVVTNTGWMIPYVSCMIVAVGMLFQFGQTLLRFLNRREALATGPPVNVRREMARATAPLALNDAVGLRGMVERYLPLAVVVLCAVMIARYAVPPRPAADGVDLYAAAKLPIQYDGRVKPLDTLARNALLVTSNRETFKDARGKTQPALRWLLDVISGHEGADKHRVFRIDNQEVLDLFGLDRREGFLYSLSEIRPRIDTFNEEVDKAHEKSREKGMGSLLVYERKLLELDRRVRAFTAIDASFARPDFPAEPTEEIRKRAAGQREALLATLAQTEERLVQKGHPPLIVPPVAGEGAAPAEERWRPFVSAWTKDYFESKVFDDRQPDPAVAGWSAILTAYKADKPLEFNSAVRKYQDLMARESPPDWNGRKVAYEAYFNQFAPFFQAWILYIVGFALTVGAWLLSIRGWGQALQRSAFWLGIFTLALHTFALASRIYISGRPPVTNLYSSAVFIGWGCVALGLILEYVFRLGIGNVISAIAGFATLFISFKLAGDGDTFTVMQAVLDTQFWLATHVVCITLGYATTFLSGLLGLVYVLRGVFTPTLSPQVGKDLSRMIYGTLCFALFFSFVGTVLGGLWADDSWGRFWGWDPKENGALMIVLWNALVLHARWDGMVKERGLAVLAVAGNIVTAWSWFGVNELGVGLHSYGFTEGVLLALGLFVLSQLLVITAGMLPRSLWWSPSHVGQAAA
ncbi:MAG: cytochrome c biogenesis protein CcsA [Planctomycetaceae bacterium]